MSDIYRNFSSVDIFLQKSIKYDKIKDIVKYLHYYYKYLLKADFGLNDEKKYLLLDVDLCESDYIITTIKKYLHNKKYVAKYIYYYRKSPSNILDIFIEFITLLINPPIYLKYIFNEYLCILLEYIIHYFKMKKSKLYLKIRDNFKKIINDYYLFINNRCAESLNPFEIYYINNNIFMVEYCKKYNLHNNINDIIILSDYVYMSYIKKIYRTDADLDIFANIRKNNISEDILFKFYLLGERDGQIQIGTYHQDKYIDMMAKYLLCIDVNIIKLHIHVSEYSKRLCLLLYNTIMTYYCKSSKNILELSSYLNFIIGHITLHENHFAYFNLILSNHEYLSSKKKYINLIKTFISDEIFYNVRNKKWLLEIYNDTLPTQRLNNIFVNIIKENIIYYNLLNTIEFLE